MSDWASVSVCLSGSWRSEARRLWDIVIIRCMSVCELHVEYVSIGYNLTL